MIGRAQGVALGLGRPWDVRLERILRFCASGSASFPGEGPTDDKGLTKYVKGYYAERERVIAVTTMGTQPDPVINEVLTAFFKKRPEQLAAIEKAHRDSMAAENLVGALLERYLATLLEPKGWIWCCGNTVKAVDFIQDQADPPQVFQIKNRSNSENSSSAGIRVGTVIKKWYRINATNGQTRWHLLPENEVGTLTEYGFYRFVTDYAAREEPAVILNANDNVVS